MEKTTRPSAMPGDQPGSAEPANELYAYVGAFIDELSRAGVGHAVVCPGSRSTPLAMTLAEQPDIRLWMHIDERSAGFFALGMARRLQQPVALVCTSGTAAANFYPAVVEARLSHVPLLLLTADRPHELRDCGAPQAIDQNRLYGQHAKWYMEVAPASATNQSLRYIRTIADRAAAAALALPAGPVHLNFPISDPLTPVPGPLMPVARRDIAAWNGRPGRASYTRVENSPAAAPSPVQVAALAERLRATSRGLIVVGPQPDPALAELLLSLGRTLGYPILADPLSQLRLPDQDVHDTVLVTTYDAFLPSEAELRQMPPTSVNGTDGDRFSPELILRFGTMPTSKSLLLYLQRHSEHCPLIVVSGDGDWGESTQLASEMMYADPVRLCTDILDAIREEAAQVAGQSEAYRRIPTQWESTWSETESLTRRVLAESIPTLSDLFEGRVFTELARLLPPESTLFAGNSMPVRDLDTFFVGNRERVHIAGNRGANGIDGVISTALGMSAAGTIGEGSERTVLVIGDLSFYHDSNGLLAAKLHRLDITIILINNDGGGIFSFLPQAAFPRQFEELFGTPTGLDFGHTVQMYGGHFQRIGDWHDFELALQESWRHGGLWVIEVPTNRDTNVQMHRQLRNRVRRTLTDSDSVTMPPAKGTADKSEVSKVDR